VCTLAAGIGFGLQAIGSIAGFAGQQSQTDAYNATARQNAINASVAATHKYEDEGRRFVYNSKKNMQEAYDVSLKDRQARATAVASAGTAGFDGSSLSLNAILADMDNQDARNMSKVQTKEDDLHDTYSSNVQSYQAEALGRINSMPFKAGPSPLALGLGIMQSGFDSTMNTNAGKNWLGAY
jgi:uncharacterized membrane protein